MNRLEKKARNWSSQVANDPHAADKKKLLRYLVSNHINSKKPRAIEWLIKELFGKKKWSKEMFQRQVIVPLREDPNVFIGTCGRGIFLVTSQDDAQTTYKFYGGRIRSEQKHWRNLRRIAKRNRLFTRSSHRKYDQKFVYIDESGTPQMGDLRTQPFFIVCAAIIAPTELAELKKKIDYIRLNILRGPAEVKSTSFKGNARKYARALKELNSVDFEFSAVCFVKKSLSSAGFKYSTSFYKYAYRTIIDHVLTYIDSATIVCDTFRNMAFMKGFESYIKECTLGFPLGQIKSIGPADSKKEAGLQLADLLAGVIRHREKGDFDLLPEIDEKLKEDVYYFFKM